MEIKVLSQNNSTIAEIVDNDIVIHETQDALDIMGNASYSGINKIIIYEHQINKEFFDLKTRLAGEILQKFSNYRMQLAIVGDFSKYKSKSLSDFIFESNKTGHILFVDSLENALNRLTKKLGLTTKDTEI